MDPIGLQIMWNRLLTIMDEVDATVVRTSFSTIVGESRDFAVIMLDGNARSVAQSQLSSPSFVCSLPLATRHMLRHFPPQTLTQGDVLMTNDPWLGHGHLFDFIVAQPVFWQGRVVAYMACAAHISDIGGRLDEFDARDVYEEGLRIPPSKLFEAGVPNEQLIRIIDANVRVPRQVVGDCHAIVGAFRQGILRLEEFLADYGADTFQHLCDTILDRSEQAMEEAIAAVPDGRYEGLTFADGYRQPTRVQLAVTVQGRRLSVDFAGSSPQQESASVNCAMNVTYAHTAHPLKCCLAPELPNNEGLYRPIAITAPEGSIFNCRFPAPVKSRTKTSYYINQALFLALAPVIPQQVQAGSGCLWALRIWGEDDEGHRTAVHVLPYGGKGALHDRDGLPTIAFPGNGTITPAEIIENNVNVLVTRRALLPGSGGAGQFRGGLGQEIALQALREHAVQVGIRADKLTYPAPGVLGGQEGARGEVLLDGQPAGPGPFPLAPGSELVLRLPGGGGFGDPARRDPALADRDVAEGYVTNPQAK